MNIKFVTLLMTSTVCLAQPCFAEASPSGQPGSTQGGASPTTAAPASAAPVDAAADQELVITARRREETVQSVPLAVTAVSQATLDRHNVTDIVGLGALTPNLRISSGSSSPTIPVIFIRGVGNRTSDLLSESPIAISVDGLYLASLAGSLLDVFDVSRVEVLRGPQGTLEGRNASGGVVSLVTRRPSEEFGARGELQYGSYDRWIGRLSVEGAIVPGILATRFSVVRETGGGYNRNIVPNTGIDNYGGRNYITGRIGFLLTPAPSFTDYLTVSYTRDTSPAAGNRFAETGGPYPTRPQTSGQGLSVACRTFGFCTPLPIGQVSLGYPSRESLTDYAITNSAEFRSDAVNVTSITGYRNVKTNPTLDLDALPNRIAEAALGPANSSQFSQEIRAASGASSDLNGHLHWVLGYYHLKADSLANSTTYVLGNNILQDISQTLTSNALFAHGDLSLTDQLTLTAGARRTWDHKSVDIRFPLPAQRLERSFTDLSVEAGAQYRFNSDHMIFVRYATGYKPGGFNNTGISYLPERLIDYEAGIRNQWFDHRLTLNLTGFYYDYRNLQRSATIPIPVSPFFQANISNVGKARMWGVELEASARPTPELTLTASVGYLNARYVVYNDINRSTGATIDNSGLLFPLAPKWTVSAAAEYRIPFLGDGAFESLALGGDVYYVSHQNVSLLISQTGDQPGYALTGAHATLRLRNEGINITGFVENMFNTHYIYQDGQVGGLTTYVYDGRPRTWGVRVGFAI